MWEEIRQFLEKDWSRSEKVVLGIICLLAGIILGFIWSPIKRGITVNSNNTTCECEGYTDEDYV